MKISNVLNIFQVLIKWCTLSANKRKHCKINSHYFTWKRRSPIGY